MGLNVTKGGLVRATLTNVEHPDQQVNCMFNPFEYTITKSNSWNPKPTKGRDVPKSEFIQGGPRSLKLTLHFDTLAENVSVKSHTALLWKMMLIDPANVNELNQKGAPPGVAFSWGGVSFQGAIFSLSEKFTLFNEKGIPVRCVVDITLQEVDDPKKMPQISASVVSAVAKSKPAVASAAQRLDNIIATMKGNPATALRKVAEANNMDNPLKPIVGAILRI